MLRLGSSARKGEAATKESETKAAARRKRLPTEVIDPVLKPRRTSALDVMVVRLVHELDRRRISQP